MSVAISEKIGLICHGKIGVLIFIIIAFPYAYFRITADWNAVDIYQLAPNYPIQFKQKLSIGSYNIAHGRGAKLGARNWQGGDKQQRRHRLENIGKLLSENNLDIVVLNEVDFSATWSHNINQAEVIAKAGNYPYIATQRNIDIYTPVAQLRFGNAILSRYPIDTADLKRFVPKSRLESLFAGNHDSLLATISLNNKQKIKLWAVHLEFRDEKTRIKAVEAMLEEQRQLNDEIILAGDFNSEPALKLDEQTAITQLIDSSYYKYFPVEKSSDTFTFPTEHPKETIDWIFIPKKYQLLSGAILKADFSDHLPISIELRIPENN